MCSISNQAPHDLWAQIKKNPNSATGYAPKDVKGTCSTEDNALAWNKICLSFLHMVPWACLGEISEHRVRHKSWTLPGIAQTLK